MKMSHMLPSDRDSLSELHSIANAIGLKRDWFQDEKTPHYDLCQEKREEAIKAGAAIASRELVVEVIRYWKHERKVEALAEELWRIGMTEYMEVRGLNNKFVELSDRMRKGWFAVARHVMKR